MLFEHREAVNFFISMLEQNEEYGVTDGEDHNVGHFKCCPWNDENCEEGPDTCRCMVYQIRKLNVENLMKLYNEIFDIYL